MQNKSFLLDTNVFFHVIEMIAKNSQGCEMQLFQEGACYISELSRIEIISVLGKHARGTSGQIHKCEQTINEKGDICGREWYVPAKKGWKKRMVADWRKLIKDITIGNSPLFKVEILPVTPEVCNVARGFVRHALNYNFGSLDAMITATAIEYRNRTGTELTMVTYDKKLLAAIRAEGTIPYLDLRAGFAAEAK